MRALLLLLIVTTALAAEQGEKHLLYLSSPDGSQPGGFGSGIMVFDIDDGHRFVKRIEVPSFKDGGVRGFAANAKTHCAYYTTTTRLMGAFDLESEKVVWERRYDAGCDRAAITPDGKKTLCAERLVAARGGGGMVCSRCGDGRCAEEAADKCWRA